MTRFIAVLVLAFGTVATAAPALAIDPARIQRSGILAAVEDGWAWLTGGVSGVFSAVTPPTPSSSAKSLGSADSSKLFKMLGDIGYKMKEIESNISPVPYLSFKFGLKQELSEPDIDWIERALERDEIKRPDLLAEAERAIIRAALDINTNDNFIVESLKIRLLPYPKAEFTLAPKESPLPRNFNILLRAVEGKPPLTWRGAYSESLLGDKK